MDIALINEPKNATFLKLNFRKITPLAKPKKKIKIKNLINLIINYFIL